MADGFSVSKANGNIDSMLKEFERGDGLLAGHQAVKVSEFEQTVKAEHISAARRHRMGADKDKEFPALTQEQIDERVNKKLADYAQNELRPLFEFANNGKNKKEAAGQGSDPAKLVEQVQYASQVGGAVNSVFSSAGNMGTLSGAFGLFGAIGTLFTYVGDYVMAGISYMTSKKGDPNAPKSFNEALENIRAPNRFAKLAEHLGVKTESLLARLNSDKKPVPVEDKPNQAAPPVSSQASLISPTTQRYAVENVEKPSGPNYTPAALAPEVKTQIA